MAVRRITSLWLLMRPNEADYVELLGLLDRSIIPAVVTVLLLIGLWGMKKSFDNFAVVEKEAKDKISTMFQRKR